MKCQILFSGKKKEKNITDLLSAEFAQKIVKGMFRSGNSIKNVSASSENVSTLKGKIMLHFGVNSFLLQQKRSGVKETKQEVTKVISLIKNGGKSDRSICPLKTPSSYSR